MKVRAIKARTVGMMDTCTHGFMHGVNRRDPKWMDRSEANEKLHFTRHLKPCKSYSAWCSDCNAVRFRTEKGRFPYNYDDFFAFEGDVQGQTICAGTDCGRVVTAQEIEEGDGFCPDCVARYQAGGVK